MTNKLEFDPVTAERIKAEARASGLPVKVYLEVLIRHFTEPVQAGVRAAIERACAGGLADSAVAGHPPGAATLALFDAWKVEDETTDVAELDRRRGESEEFQAAMNSNRPGQRAIYPCAGSYCRMRIRSAC